jgi:hypothetical protein
MPYRLISEETVALWTEEFGNAGGAAPSPEGPAGEEAHACRSFT